MCKTVAGVVICLSLIAAYFFIFHTTNDSTFKLLEPRHKRHKRPNCSFSSFREIANHTTGGYLSGYGTWKRNSEGKIYRFLPSLCKLQYGTQIPGEKVKSCFHRQNISYVVILGDSNGLRYFFALHAYLSQLRGVQCTPVSRNYSVINWMTYEHKDMHVIHRCRCGHTHSGRCTINFADAKRTRGYVIQAQCHINASKDVSVAVEYAVSSQTIWHTTHDPFTLKTGCQPSRHKSVITANLDSWQRFYFASFFANPRPDLFIVFGNAHDHMLLRTLVGDIDAFAKLIDQYIIAPTRLIWVSRIAEDVRKKPKHWRLMRYEHGTMTRLEWLDAANRILYRRMHRRFLDSNKLLLFPDILQMSRPVMDDFNLDGVHMKPEWYRYVISYIIQTLCTGS